VTPNNNTNTTKRQYKQIRVPKEVYDRLTKLGTVGNSLGEVIALLIEEHEERQKRQKRHDY
jgi:predicted CopG family antitoxin